MKIIVIASQKGGSGKTTLCAHLAVEAERVGDSPTWLVDTDKQGTLSLWHERRNADTPQRADVSFSQLENGLVCLPIEVRLIVLLTHPRQFPIKMR